MGRPPKPERHAELVPLHASIAGRGPRRPFNMETIQVPDEVRVGLTQLALSVFTDCCNVGVPFQDALLAVYLTGLENGTTTLREQMKVKRELPY